MDVRVIPNRFRPGVGRYPAEEKRRAFLPQHVRMLPPVEAANRLGVLIYPPLHDHESVLIEARGNGALRISWFASAGSGQRGVAFVATVHRSGGPGGMDAVDVSVVDPLSGYDEQEAVALITSVISGLNSPPGTVGIRGAHNLVTSPGWDTVFLPVLNDLQRPTISPIALRVQTDRIPFESEFRVLLEKGDVLSLIGSGPIGQAVFVPREPISLGPGRTDEQDAFQQRLEQFLSDAVRARRVTRYGGAYTDFAALEVDGYDGALHDPGAVAGARERADAT